MTHEPDIANYVERVIVVRDGHIASDRRQTPAKAIPSEVAEEEP